jgi:hypothetical protein
LSVESILLKDHQSLGDMLGNVEKSLSCPDVKAAFDLLDEFWARLAVHIRAENLCLFPATVAALKAERAESLPAAAYGIPPAPAEAANIIARLRSDHNFFMTELSLAIKKMRELMAADEVPDRILAEVRGKVKAVAMRLATHNELEERAVYRWPELVLDSEAAARLAAEVQKELDNLPPRLERTP